MVTSDKALRYWQLLLAIALYLTLYVCGWIDEWMDKWMDGRMKEFNVTYTLFHTSKCAIDMRTNQRRGEVQ